MCFDSFIWFLSLGKAENLVGARPGSPWIPEGWPPFAARDSPAVAEIPCIAFIGPGEGKLRENNDEFERQRPIPRVRRGEIFFFVN
jgi:hypothetical protein